MLGWFVETTLVASGLAAIAALAGRLRSIGPTIRHALWLVVLVKLMTPPLLCWPWAISWRVPDWPWPSSAAATIAPAALVRVETDECRSLPPSPSPLCRPAVLTASVKRVDVDLLERHSGLVPVASLGVETAVAPSAPDAPAIGSGPGRRDWLLGGLFTSWLAVSMLVGTIQAYRVIRFHRRLRTALLPPESLVEEAVRIGRWLRVAVPEILVVPDLGTPLLWCLGRPKLLLPMPLVKSLDLNQWRGILIHELAHLRRRDHWVCRLELAASVLWWWNPLYWLTCARLGAEAELACDAWVVWALPKDRVAYAEVLFDICSTLSLAGSPAPALGAAGSGRFFERRLTMILHEPVPCRLSRLGLLIACLLVAFAVPSWSAATPVAPSTDEVGTVAKVAPVSDLVSTVSIDDNADLDDAAALDDDDDADDDDDTPAARARAKAREEARKAREAARKARDDARKARDEARAKIKEKMKELDPEVRRSASRIEKELESKFGHGSDFEKKIEELGEKIGKEIESRFGPEFEEKMEALGKELEAKFGSGSEFVQKLKELGKEIEAKFGPGSEFEKSMKDLGKEIGAKFGPGSEFEKSMKDLGQEMEAKFGPDSEFMKKLREKTSSEAKGQKETGRSPSGTTSRPGATESRDAAPAAAVLRRRARERRIEALEAQIRKLAEELKELKAGDDDSDE
jgi:beta-lactamase regulating signal transducer with metallopeptidase domain